jgi:hypothetical protein
VSVRGRGCGCGRKMDTRCKVDEEGRMGRGLDGSKE